MNSTSRTHRPSPRPRLTEGPVGRRLAALTLPMVGGIFSVIALNLVDTFFVAQLGTRELAAISFTFPVVMVMGSLALGLGAGTASVVARAIGEGDHHRVRCLATHSLLLAVLIVAVFVAVGLATIDPLFRLLGAGPELLPLIHDYLLIWYPGMVFLVVPMVGNSVIRAGGDTAFPSLIMTVAALTNAVLDPLLIFGLAGFPRLEMQGAALATVIARGLTLVAALLVLHYRERVLIWQWPILSELLDSWRAVLHVGLPAAATNMVNPISTAIITALLAGFGAEAVAAFGVATRIEALALMVIMALAASVGPFVGQNWGARRYARVFEALRLASLFSIGWGLLVAVLLALTGPSLAGLFDDHPQVVAIASLYLLMVPVSYGGNGVIMVSGAVFNALGQPLRATVVTLARWLLLYIPLAFIGGRLYGVAGVFAAACFSNLAVGVGAFLWNRHSCRQRAGAGHPGICDPHWRHPTDEQR